MRLLPFDSYRLGHVSTPAVRSARAQQPAREALRMPEAPAAALKTNRKPSDVSIAVVGAGPGGLAAAQELIAQGFKVTVFERNPSAGGKVKTVMIDGHAIDVGAIAGAMRFGPFGTDYDPIFELSKELGVATRQFELSTAYDLQAGKPFERTQSWTKLLPGVAKYVALQLFGWRGQHDGEIGPGLSDELKKTWSEVLRSRGMESVEDAFQPLLTSAGYPPELAAFHQASYLDPSTLAAMLLQRGLYVWEGGYQQVFQRLADRLSREGVRFIYGADVSSIARNDEAMEITTPSGTQRFDEVVVACDASKLLESGTLKASAKTLDVIAKTDNAVDYRVVICRVTGLPYYGKLSTGSIPENIGRAGEPLLYCQQAPGIYTFYAYGTGADGKPVDDETLIANIAKTIPKMSPGAKLESVAHTERWAYAPHAKAEDVQNGFLDDLYALQGREGLAFVLAAASFETTARVMQHGKAVARRVGAIYDDRYGVQRGQSWWQIFAGNRG